ncbi:TetR/AcrR family transcriptional regulator [Microbacterium sp. A93]|uniref:TetR/AcrR family transcriptional regulator n=1 Tax=Microbacterium sp. A93 TaxID=3450716 RepID=UPI003F433507
MSEPRRGAPRSEAARQAILQATAHLFQTRGYENLSIEGIAAEAGVGKQTIYRWWPAKSALVAECLLEGRLLPGRLSLPDTGDLKQDLIDWVQQIFAVMREPTGRSLVNSLIAAATANEEIGARLRDSLGGAESVIDRLRSGIQTGHLASDAPVVELSEALVGALLLKALGGGSTEPEDAARLVEALLRV